MMTTHSPVPREAPRRASEAAHLEPVVWQRILQNVRLHHPTLNRVWFEQMVPRQLTNGVIQVTVLTAVQLNFCQNQCQQPFTQAAQSITGRLVSVSFHCDNLPRGGVFNEGDQQVPLNPDYVFPPSASSRARPITRSSFTAASVWARRISFRPSARRCWKSRTTRGFCICHATRSSTSSSPPSRRET